MLHLRFMLFSYLACPLICKFDSSRSQLLLDSVKCFLPRSGHSVVREYCKARTYHVLVNIIKKYNIQYAIVFFVCLTVLYLPFLAPSSLLPHDLILSVLAQSFFFLPHDLISSVLAHSYNILGLPHDLISSVLAHSCTIPLICLTISFHRYWLRVILLFASRSYIPLLAQSHTSFRLTVLFTVIG